MAADQTAAVVRAYLTAVTLSSGMATTFTAPTSSDRRQGKVGFVRASVRGASGATPMQGDDLLMDIEIHVREPVRGLQLLISNATLEGNPVCAVSNGDYRAEWDLQPGRYSVTVHFSSVRFLPQTHKVSLRAVVNWGAEVFEDWPDALTFNVLGRDVLGTGISLLADRGVTWIPAHFHLSTLSTQ